MIVRGFSDENWNDFDGRIMGKVGQVPLLEFVPHQGASYLYFKEHHWSRPVAETFNMDLNLLEDNDEIALQQKAARLIDRFMFCTLKKVMLCFVMSPEFRIIFLKPDSDSLTFD